ncbi:MAG: arylformamidase [Nocardioides sp.]|nr:arylformamidase [Nocardioides sp.]
MTRLWDISPPVHADSPVFPGDHPTEIGWTFRIGPGCPVNVAELTLSAHVGSHADAPLHFADGERTAGELPLEPYLGRCVVVHAIGARPYVGWDALAGAEGAERVLVRTYETAPVDRWEPAFAAISPDALSRLAASGTRLIGTDAASLDPAESKDLPAHMAAHRGDVRILENLVLDDVDEGEYELIALPLKLVTADAAPVRAVLRTLS